MDVLTRILKLYPNLNESQKEAITHVNGPLKITAGPGTGKTLVLVLRTLYLLMAEEAIPSEILLTTYTEKSASEIKQRIMITAKEVGYNQLLYDLKVGTVHGICNSIVERYIHYTPLKKNYTILDELTQKLFLYSIYDDTIMEEGSDLYQKWKSTSKSLFHFNKLVEELVNYEVLVKSRKILPQKLAQQYKRYRKLMLDHNLIDFSHMQSFFWEILNNEDLYTKIKGNTKFIMIDEYQDTSYIQEKIFLALACPDYNICVVGDEDQSLYRFRGAKVQNIIEFHNLPEIINRCKHIQLTINYRSHKSIIDLYNKFINSISWENKNNICFRNKKAIELDSKDNSKSTKYPALFRIYGKDKLEESEKICEMIAFLKEKEIIKDYSEIAILLRSVRPKYCQEYIDALNNHKIPFFAPRARLYFEKIEVKTLVACYAFIFDIFSDGLIKKLDYYNELADILDEYPETKEYIHAESEELFNQNKSSNTNLLDFFYELISYKPFSDMLKDTDKARNIARFSRLVNDFQKYYKTTDSKDDIKQKFFNEFLNFLIIDGVYEYEPYNEPYNEPLINGYVQLMTIHQSKGLEFPVVIVGSLYTDASFGGDDDMIADFILGEFYHRKNVEPAEKVKEFDMMRLFYVAFSRAKKMLILAGGDDTKKCFSSVWNELNCWEDIKDNVDITSIKTIFQNESKNKTKDKKEYSITSLYLYDQCPKQYQFYKEYDFAKCKADGFAPGLLVHQTIEDIHNFAKEDMIEKIVINLINEWFSKNYEGLICKNPNSISLSQKEMAWNQVLCYFNENRELLENVDKTEFDIYKERDHYIMHGRIDLLLNNNGQKSLIDFKWGVRPANKDDVSDNYFKQLCFYAYLLQDYLGKLPDSICIYWTKENKRENALMEFKCNEDDVISAINYFDNIVKNIESGIFDDKFNTNSDKCKQCEFYSYCSKDIKTKNTVEFRKINSISITELPESKIISHKKNVLAKVIQKLFRFFVRRKGKYQ